MQQYRPFQRETVDELERAFRHFFGDRTKMQHIREELHVRSSNAAKALLREVDRALAGSGRGHAIDELIEDASELDRSLDRNSPQARAAEVKIAELRSRLLDLSNRNRLISFKHVTKGARQVRVVAEWLPQLYTVVTGEKPVELLPLPPLPATPEDEEDDEFKDALEEALLTDKTYLKAVEKVEEEPEEKAEFAIEKAERALRDRIRKKLGWPTRTEALSISIPEQAKRLGIDPSYDLSNREPRRLKRKLHQWQTLLSEDELDRRMRSLEKQARESREEYGVETLYLALGFLEWRETTPGGEAEAPNLSPILLVPISIQNDKPGKLSRTEHGRLLIDSEDGASKKRRDVYTIQGDADEVSVNICLIERLRQEGIELPTWNEELGAEVFLRQVQQAIADQPGWKVRSYATISHLTFNRLAMWLDLDPEKPGVKPPHIHPVLGELFGGGVESDDGSDGANEEDAEAGVPSLIMDCDSSQFAAIRSALNGRNLTIQGPPGTGKSQTIANLIASLLHQGKTVLFVAEKMAALDVVHSRLTEAGVGDFLLELHSAKAAKKAVLESIRSRLSRPRRTYGGLSSTITTRRKVLRDKLNAYAAAINSVFGASGLTIHDIIWRCYEYRNKPLPEHLVGYRLPEVGEWDKDAVEYRTQALVRLVELQERYRSEQTTDAHPWSWVENCNLHVDECDRLYHHAIDLLLNLTELQSWLEQIDLVALPSSYFALHALSGELAALGSRPIETTSGLWNLAGKTNAEQTVEAVIAAHEKRTESEDYLRGIAPALLRPPSDLRSLESLSELAARVIPETAASTNSDLLAARRAENTQLFCDLESAIKLMAQIQIVLRWSGSIAEPELAAASKFIELAGAAPSAIFSKKHNLGEDRAVAYICGKLEEMRRCEALIAAVQPKLKVPFESLDHSQLLTHRDELLNGGLFAFLRKAYREARTFCRNACPEVAATERLSFLAELCDLVEMRNRLDSDEPMRRIAGELFTGWSTSKQALEACCAWIEIVRQRTPILEAYSPQLRQVLFSITQDQADMARDLAAGSWPRLCLSLAEKCRRQSVALHDLRNAIQHEQDTIEQTIDRMRALEWEGELSRDRLERVHSALRTARESDDFLSKNPGVLNLLLPDPHAALACVRAIAAAQRQVKSLPIQEAWKERLSAADSANAWTDFHAHTSGLETSLDVIEKVTDKLAALAKLHQRNRANFEHRPIGEWITGMRAAVSAERLLSTRAHLLASKAEIATLNLEKFVDGARGPAMAKFDGISDLFQCVYLRSMAFLAFEEHACLSEFRHTSPTATREKFGQLDIELKTLHRQELVDRLMERRPPAGIDTGLIRDRSELGLLSYVAHRGKTQTSIHALVRRAGRALQAIKPCFMMSPLSVAQLIDRESLNFDVVIFDEASQVRPEDAMSALARGRQFVVVGDQMQLPPTSFGEKTVNDEPLDADDSGEVEESAAVESILELASAAYGNGRKLLWHYRSRDPSLIAYSNQEFYQKELLLFPCPAAKTNATGIKYVWVGGRYSARTNAEEARTCALAAVELMRKSPDRSLGIVALNRPQADLIQLELDRLIQEHPEAADYQAKWAQSLEPLFVKNLENVQGDERDVIFVSTVFGEDESGRFFQRFGPINSAVGHRRLNVLFTRAKFQLIVFTSLPTEKIQLAEKSHWGVRALKEYLDFAHTGRLERGIGTGRSADSPFEIAVRTAIETAGFQCEPQVGIAGFFVDLGVRHPRFPEHFLAGIECDGAAYHSTRAARDRDRLRQSVLESFGWKIFRIWSTDWFRDPHGQLERLISSLEELKSIPAEAANKHSFDFAARFGKPRLFTQVTATPEPADKPAKT